MPYPKPGVYYIQSSSKLDCYASIRHGGERVLRGESLDPRQYSQKWRLDYVNDADNSTSTLVLCAFTEADSKDKFSLGVNSVEQYQPVYGLDSSQSWFLKQTDIGYIVGKLSADPVYTWYLGKKGEPIVIINDGRTEAQSWQFVPADE
ncbi:hypothetical protein DFH29DRAFT_1006588 [Suillus ampliporus]|nr:hypothetical protein DFH29DRAFT_1006588 [Suillus ampliporus]